MPEFLLRIDKSVGTSHSATIAAAKGGAQNTCNPTGVIGGSGSMPNSTFGPVSFPLYIHNPVDEDDPADDVIVTTTVDNLTFENVLPNGDTPAEDGTFTATLRAREVYPLFTIIIGVTPDSFCDALFQSYRVNCEPCPTDGEPYCLTLTAIGVGAIERSIGIQKVAIEDRDPSCADVIPP